MNQLLKGKMEMSAVLKIVDKQLGQVASDSFELHLASERLTARKLIERRVADEVALIKEKPLASHSADGHTRPFLIRHDANPVERKLNAPRPEKRRKPISESDEIKTAISGFESNQFVMLFDDRQIEDLDNELTVTPTSEVVFLRMVPLVGG